MDTHAIDIVGAIIWTENAVYDNFMVLDCIVLLFLLCKNKIHFPEATDYSGPSLIRTVWDQSLFGLGLGKWAINTHTKITMNMPFWIREGSD